jgi:hypothetical protein
LPRNEHLVVHAIFICGSKEESFYGNIAFVGLIGETVFGSSTSKQVDLGWEENSMNRIEKPVFFIFKCSDAEMSFWPKEIKSQYTGPQSFFLQMSRYGFKQIR